MGLLDFLLGSDDKPKIDPLTGQTIVPTVNPLEEKQKAAQVTAPVPEVTAPPAPELQVTDGPNAWTNHMAAKRYNPETVKNFIKPSLVEAVTAQPPAGLGNEARIQAEQQAATEEQEIIAQEQAAIQQGIASLEKAKENNLSPAAVEAIDNQIKTLQDQSGVYDERVAGGPMEVPNPAEQTKERLELRKSQLDAKIAEDPNFVNTHEGKQLIEEIGALGGMIPQQQAQTEAVNKVIKETPAIQDAIKVAQTTNEKDATQGTTPEEADTAKKTADAIVSQMEDTDDESTFDEIVNGAKSFLGDLFSSTAFKRALVYYLGARLMGYSASGSGMAAGEVLIEGWKTEDELGVKAAEAAAKKAEDDALDKSKTVRFTDGQGRVKHGYVSKSGRFQDFETGMVYEDPRAAGLRPMASTDKTRDETVMEAYGNMDKMIANQIAAIEADAENKGYNEGNIAKVRGILSEGGLGREAVLKVVDAWGINAINTAGSQAMLAEILGRYSRGVAAGEIGYDTASLSGFIDRSLITAEGGSVPQAVYKNAKGVEASSDNLNALSNSSDINLQRVNGDMVKIINSDLSAEKKQATVNALAALSDKASHINIAFQMFKSLPAEQRKYFEGRATGGAVGDTTPFILWYTGSTDKDAQYQSFNAMGGYEALLAFTMEQQKSKKKK